MQRLLNLNFSQEQTITLEVIAVLAISEIKLDIKELNIKVDRLMAIMEKIEGDKNEN